MTLPTRLGRSRAFIAARRMAMRVIAHCSALSRISSNFTTWCKNTSAVDLKFLSAHLRGPLVLGTLDLPSVRSPEAKFRRTANPLAANAFLESRVHPWPRQPFRSPPWPIEGISAGRSFQERRPPRPYSPLWLLRPPEPAARPFWSLRQPDPGAGSYMPMATSLSSHLLRPPRFSYFTCSFRRNKNQQVSL
jgi:hypothetical protein